MSRLVLLILFLPLRRVCGIQTLTVCVECISYANVLRVLVLSYA